MKKRDLKYPFTWSERKPLIRDRVFYVPNQWEGEWTFPGWADPEVFDAAAPIWIEYCSGNGAWILEKAKAHPEWNWVAVEKRFARIRQIYAKRENEKIRNLFIVCGEALNFTRHYGVDEGFAGAYINFPDPWPKGRHAKHRLFQDDFIAQLARVLKKEAQATIVTDYADYATKITVQMQSHPQWESVYAPPHFVTEWEGDYGTSFFDDLWRKKGRTIHYLQFRRIGS